MRKERKHYTGDEKVAILRRHLLDKVPVSDLCDELGLQPTVFYRWQKEFFENGAAAFQSKSRPDHQAEQQRIEFLEKKIQTKDEVLAELMAEHIALKKVLGSSDQSVGAARRAGDFAAPLRVWISQVSGLPMRIDFVRLADDNPYLQMHFSRSFSD